MIELIEMLILIIFLINDKSLIKKYKMLIFLRTKYLVLRPNKFGCQRYVIFLGNAVFGEWLSLWIWTK